MSACGHRPATGRGGLSSVGEPSPAETSATLPAPTTSGAATGPAKVIATKTATKTPTTKPVTPSPSASKPIIVIKPDWALSRDGTDECDASLDTDGDIIIGGFFQLTMVSGFPNGNVTVAISNDENNDTKTVSEAVPSKFFVTVDIGPATGSKWAGHEAYLDADISPTGDSNSADNGAAQGVDVPAGIATYTLGAANGVPCHPKIG